MAVIKCSKLLNNCDGYSLSEYLDTKKDLPDYDGEMTVCGEGSCETINRGAAKSGESGAKIWGMPVSSNSCSPILFARDAGIGDLSVCDLMTGEHMKPEYIAKNPFHQIP